MPGAPDAAEKERLVETFRACLDDWDDANAADDTPADRIDLHTLLSEMAALRTDVRLQSRQGRTALDELRAFGERLDANNQRLEQELQRTREQGHEIRRQTERKVLLELLDIVDSLHAGAEAAGRAAPSRLARWLLPGPLRLIDSLAQGQALTLARAQEALKRLGVRTIDAAGQRLDPERMRAVAVEHRPDQPEGVVLREARRGYTHDGELLRTAEVIVNKKASNA